MLIEDLHRTYFHSLNTPRLVLRPLMPEDAEAMFEYTSCPENFRFLRRAAHQTVREDQVCVNGVLEGYRLHREFVWGICLRENDRVIGTCRMFDIQLEKGCCEVSYLIHSAFQGQGIASEAIRELIRYAFEELGLLQVQARCATENIASERVMQKCGMGKEAVLAHHAEFKGIWFDFYLYSIKNEVTV